MDEKSKTIISLVLTVSIFILGIAAITSPIYFPVLAGNSSIFNVSLTINNDAPTITNVEAIADSPAEGTTKVVSFYFNATDSNGVADIPGVNANITINQSGVSLSNSEVCVAIASTVTTNMYECNLTINYYNLPGLWDINATVFDGAAATAEDLTSADLTMGTTYGISISKTSITFNGNPGDNDVNASNNPQLITNEGNAAFTQVDVKGYELLASGNIIAAGNFSVAGTDTPSGNAMVNNTDVTIAGASVSIQGTQNLFVYADIPTGTPDGSYLSVSDWVITAS